MSDRITTDSRNRPGTGLQDGGDKPSGEYLARLFKYCRQARQASSDRIRIPFNRVSAKSFYSEHRKAFDDTAAFFSSHGLDAKPYIEFFVNDLSANGYDIDEKLYSKRTISEYATKLQAAEKRKKIYGWFMKSVSNIVDMCIEYDYASGNDCILALIRSKRLAGEFVSGRISKYFLAALPSFRSVIPKLDHFAKAEFAELYDKFDIYNTEINDTFLRYRNRTANPFETVDRELAKRKRVRRSEKPQTDLFDPDL